MADAAVGLFAGVGGIELGLERSGFSTSLLCELLAPAKAVLTHRFPHADLVSDVRDLKDLPGDTEVLSAGFPCQDLSQAGRMAGIAGSQSSLVGDVFRLIARRSPTWIVLENVPFMLQLDKGRAMEHLVASMEALGLRWAYRVVDSRFTGVPQRRRRVIVVASPTEDPCEVLFADDAGERPASEYATDSFGFYWTEGRYGVGWAVDAIPTLKGGSTIGIPSPPAIWVPGADEGQLVITPSLEECEELQGLPRGWSSAADRSQRGVRWRLIGNAVTAGVAAWVGSRLKSPGPVLPDRVSGLPGRWPLAASGHDGQRFTMTPVSEFPLRAPYRHLTSVVDVHAGRPLSRRAAEGFLSRALSSRLHFEPEFLRDVHAHVANAAKVSLSKPARPHDVPSNVSSDGLEPACGPC